MLADDVGAFHMGTDARVSRVCLSFPYAVLGGRNRYLGGVIPFGRRVGAEGELIELLWPAGGDRLHGGDAARRTFVASHRRSDPSRWFFDLVHDRGSCLLRKLPWKTSGGFRGGINSPPYLAFCRQRNFGQCRCARHAVGGDALMAENSMQKRVAAPAATAVRAQSYCAHCVAVSQ